MKIVDIVKFNSGHAFVVDSDPQLLFSGHGDILIGEDETETVYSVYQYGACGGNPNFGGNYAFGGRKFYLPMKDGSVTHCYGQWWDGGYKKAEEILGISLASFTHSTKEQLKSCYVFYGGTINAGKLSALIDEFYVEHPNYEPYEYRGYEAYLKEATQAGEGGQKWE
jgi:hypothetical protein